MDNNTQKWLIKWQFLANVIFIISMVLVLSLCHCKKQKNACKPSEKEVLIQTDTVYIPGDSFPYNVYVKTAPEPVNTIKIPTPANADTSKVIPDYYTQKYYSDSVRNDTSYFLKYKLWISKNAVDSIKFDLQNLRKKAVITNNTFLPQPEPEKPKRKISVGIFTGGNLSRAAFGPGIIYMSRNENTFGYEYDAIGKMHLIRYYKTAFKF